MPFDPKQRPKKSKDFHSIFAPLAFLVLFVLFVYGSFLVALLGASAFFIDFYDLSFFARLGSFGSWWLTLCFLGGWLGGVSILSAIPYFILRHMGRYQLADNVRLYVMIALVGIFIVPFILWRMIRNNHPVLRRRYRQKLKRQARGRKMQERLQERRRFIKSRV